MTQAKRIIRALFFDRKAYDELKNDGNAMIPGIVFVLIFGLAAAFSTEKNSQMIALVIVPLFYFIYWQIFAGIISMIPQLFGGKASFEEYIKVFNYSAIPFTLGLMPVIGFIANIWGIAYIILATKEVYGLTWPKAIKGTITLMILSFFFTIALLPYLVSPYGSIHLSGLTLVSKPVQEGLSNFKISDITINDKNMELVSYNYKKYSENGRGDCVRDTVPGSIEVHEHSFILSPIRTDATIKSIDISRDTKPCCVYLDYFGKTLRSGYGARVDAICRGESTGGGVYDLEIAVSYETTENGVTSSHTDTGHIKGPNEIDTGL
jgi:hypothetical protein